MSRSAELLAYASGRAEAPASYEQEWMLHLSRMRPPGTLNLPRLYEVAPGIGVEHVVAALTALAHRHGVLRTRFRRRAGAFVQVVADEVAPPAILKAGTRDEALARAREFAADPLDPSHGPPFRSAVVVLPGGGHLLATVTHHAVADAVTLDALDRMIRAEIVGAPERTGGLTYADYAAWQRDTYGPGLDRELDEYADALGGAAAPSIPGVAPRSAAADAGLSAGFDLASVDTDALRKLLTEERASLFMAGLTALGATLRALGGGSDLIIGIEMSTRTLGPLRTVLGLFASTIPVRLRAPGTPGFRDGLRATRDTMLHAYGRAHLPYHRLIGRPALRGLRRGGETAVDVVYQTFHERAAATSRDTVARVPFTLPGAGATADLHVSLHESPAGLRLMVGHTARVPGTVVADLAERFEAVLRQGALDPDGPMGGTGGGPG